MTNKQELRRLARNLTRFRTEAGLSMSELGSRIGGWASTIQRIEDEISMPGFDVVGRIADELGKKTDDFRQELRVAAGV